MSLYIPPPCQVHKDESLLEPNRCTAEELHNKVRAFAGWPGSHMEVVLKDLHTGKARISSINITGIPFHKTDANMLFSWKAIDQSSPSPLSRLVLFSPRTCPRHWLRSRLRQQQRPRILRDCYGPVRHLTMIGRSRLPLRRRLDAFILWAAGCLSPAGAARS